MQVIYDGVVRHGFEQLRTDRHDLAVRRRARSECTLHPTYVRLVSPVETFGARVWAGLVQNDLLAGDATHTRVAERFEERNERTLLPEIVPIGERQDLAARRRSSTIERGRFALPFGLVQHDHSVETPRDGCGVVLTAVGDDDDLCGLAETVQLPSMREHLPDDGPLVQSAHHD